MRHDPLRRATRALKASSASWFSKNRDASFTISTKSLEVNRLAALPDARPHTFATFPEPLEITASSDAVLAFADIARRLHLVGVAIDGFHGRSDRKDIDRRLGDHARYGRAANMVDGEQIVAEDSAQHFGLVLEVARPIWTVGMQFKAHFSILKSANHLNNNPRVA